MQQLQKFLTNIKSSSAPLNRKIIGRGGTQPESTVSLAISSIDAVKEDIIQIQSKKSKKQDIVKNIKII